MWSGVVFILGLWGRKRAPGAYAAGLHWIAPGGAGEVPLVWALTGGLS